MPATMVKSQIEGRKRLFPSITNPNWLVLNKRREIFKRWLRQIDFKDPVVLDVGGRIQPYRLLVSKTTSRYIAIDLVPTPLVNVIGNAAQLPIRNESIDLVICTQMLQYAPHPRWVIDEIHRVLKPGGHLLISVPAVYPQDSENEYWRFLPPAIRDMLDQFSQVEVIAEGGSLSGFIRTINVCFISFATVKIFRTCFSFTLVPLLNLLGMLLERLEIIRDTSFSANYSALAKK